MRQHTVRIGLLAALALAGLTACGSSGDPLAFNPNLFTANLSGAQEVPPVLTAATGQARVLHNPLTDTIDIEVTVTGIAAANVTGMHVHLGAAGVNGPVIVDVTGLGVAFQDIGGGEIRAQGSDLPFPPGNVGDLRTLGCYVNVHTVAVPGGQVRGQLTP